MHTSTADKLQPIPTTPPAGWQHQMPKYRVVRDVRPAEKRRLFFENPVTEQSAADVWQFSDDRVYRAGETVETKAWPHPSFQPLNFCAQQILRFFQSSPKSRMALTPYDARGRLQLDTGLGGPVEFNVAPPTPKPFDSRPVRF